MLSHRTMTKLAQLIEAIAKAEVKVELAREDLSTSSLFEPFTVFKRLDSGHKGYLTASDLVDFLYENAVKVDRLDMDNIIASYHPHSPRLNYSNFLDMVLPKQDKYLRTRATLREPYETLSYSKLPSKVESDLVALLEREIQLERIRVELVEDLAIEGDYSPTRAFDTLDFNRNGFVDTNELHRFLREHNIFLSESELTSFIRRVDIDHDSIASISEMRQFLSRGRLLHSDYYLLDNSILHRSASAHKRSRLHLSNDFTTPTKSAISKDLNDYSYKAYLRGISTSPRRYSVSKAYADYLASPRRRVIENTPPRRVYSPRRTYSPRVTDYSTPTRRGRTYYDVVADEYIPTRRFRYTYSPTRYYSPLKERLIEEKIHKIENEEELVLALKEQINVEREVEDAKCDLALKAEFNLLETFRSFDTAERGRINAAQMEKGLNRYGVYPLSNELQLLVKRMDGDDDGYVTYAEFAAAMSPNNETYASMVRHREPRYITNDELIPFTGETRDALAKVIRLMCRAERCEELTRQRLSHRRGSSLYEMFSALDKHHKGYVTIDEFKKIFEEYGIFTSRSDLNNLVEKLDTNGDGRVTFREFYHEMTPHSRKVLY